MYSEGRIESDDLDFGTLVIALGQDDDVTFTVYDGQPVITLPIYNFQARELIEALQPIAELEDMT
jgi:hypothetical protein